MEGEHDYRVIGWTGSFGVVRPQVFGKVKVSFIFDRHTHDFFLGENGKTH